jgi:hypothetical protein
MALSSGRKQRAAVIITSLQPQGYIIQHMPDDLIALIEVTV